MLSELAGVIGQLSVHSDLAFPRTGLAMRLRVAAAGDADERLPIADACLNPAHSAEEGLGLARSVA